MSQTGPAVILAVLLASPIWGQQGYLMPARDIAKAVLRDQKQIWQSPGRVEKRDLVWLAPLAGTTAFLLATDERNMQERWKTNETVTQRSNLVANGGLAALAAIPAYLSWRGWKYNDRYATESAITSARAATGAIIATQILGLLTWRERPSQGAGEGRFYASGTPFSSFASMHSAAAWAMAPVMAERYPGWATKAGVYGLATAVSAARITGHKGFPSDVLVGSSLGWLIGRAMARPGGLRGLGRSVAFGEGVPEGSVYVSMDSWIYPALDRLAALGLVPSQTAGLRPWTRRECLRQAKEAAEMLARFGDDEEAAVVARPLVSALLRELETSAGTVVLERVYLTSGVIAGAALNDSFHFGQTWIENSGRPYGRGFNLQTGFSMRAEAGRYFAYYRGEYQQAPGRDPHPLPVRELIAGLDSVPVQEAQPRTNTNRFRPMEAYVGVRLANFEISAGKQELWYAPNYSSPLSFSTNAEPTKNGRIAMVHPYRLPGVLRHLGEIRGEFVIGKLGGHKYTWRPWFNSAKLSFKLTENLEFGFHRWSIFWGVGHPITVRSFFRNFTSTSSAGTTFELGDRLDPGDRKGGFDFKYRIPGLRNWLTIYSDSYSDDDPSPLAAPRRAAINPGIHLVRIPGVPKLDLRVEAPSTMPVNGDYGGKFIYFNNQYRSGNTNYGNLLGSWVGRDARAIQAWSSYWFSPRTRVEVGYRHLKGGAKFLPGGSTQTAGTLKAELALSNGLHAAGVFQYERFAVPVLGGPQHNWSGRLTLAWEPNFTLLK